LGTVNPQTGGGLPVPVSSEVTTALAQQLRDQATLIAELRARLASVEALLASAARRK
jgi:hypothetical protein